MNVANTSLRRGLTVVGVAAALVIGFGAIRASAEWTAATAPLHGRAGVGRDIAGSADR